jgi:hypothetical protein
MIPHIQGPRRGRLMKAEGRMWVPGTGNEKLVLIGERDGKFWRWMGGDGYTT